MKRLLLGGMAAAILLVGCQTEPPAFTEAERAETVAEIRSARDAHFVAATELDADALVAFWDQDFIHVSNATVAPLPLEVLREGWRPLSHIEMEVTSDRVVALSRNAGYTMTTASTITTGADTIWRWPTAQLHWAQVQARREPANGCHLS
jgi:hypothetical protein